jgi:hypothetical protein
MSITAGAIEKCASSVIASIAFFLCSLTVIEFCIETLLLTVSDYPGVEGDVFILQEVVDR